MQDSAQSNSYVNQYSPPAEDVSEPAVAASPPSQNDVMEPSSVSTPPATTSPAMPSDDASDSSKSEKIEDQNIFELLGVSDGSDQEKESFLDELQQVIWDDFLENDMELLITSDELTQAQAILNKPGDDSLQKQEELVQFLEKLIPDLEDIMLEKALELKEEMVRERIAGMKEFFVDKPEAIEQLIEAERLIDSKKWSSATDKLNAIKK